MFQYRPFRAVSTDLLSIVLGYRADEWRRNPKMRETARIPAFFDTSQAELHRRTPSRLLPTPTASVRDPAIEKWNNYDCSGRFATRELVKIQ